MAEQRVVTPEAVPLELPLASVGSRFLAILLDWTIQAVALVLVLLAGGVASAAGGIGDRGVVAALMFVAVFLVIFGYPVAFETLRRGRTPGKAALGLRVVTREGAPVRFRDAAIRSALGLVDFALTAGAAAVVSVMVSRDSQRLGDLVAGTVVVRERSGLKAPAPVDFSVPVGLESLAATIDPAGLSPSDYATVRSFLLRSPSLPAPARDRIAADLAATVAARVRAPVPPDVTPERYLRTVAAVRQGGVPPGSARLPSESDRNRAELDGGEFAPPT